MTKTKKAPVAVLLDRDPADYRPGDGLRARAEALEFGTLPVHEGEWQLVWYTEGTGDEDVGIAARERLAPGEGIAPFSTRLPEGPRSYDGRIVKIRWAVRLEAKLASGAIVDTAADLQLLPLERR